MAEKIFSLGTFLLLDESLTLGDRKKENINVMLRCGFTNTSYAMCPFKHFATAQKSSRSSRPQMCIFPRTPSFIDAFVDLKAWCGRSLGSVIRAAPHQCHGRVPSDTAPTRGDTGAASRYTNADWAGRPGGGSTA